MEYIDIVYGKFEITEPVVLELINSKPLQRLKKIDQAGYKPLWKKPDTIVPGHEHSRFSHSVGVYLLLKSYGAPLEEQIAGLLHDVSHSAFSHCIDYVLDNGSQKEHDYQDNMHDDFVKKSEIPAILTKYGLDLEYILDDKNFPLKEKDLPDLCADRIDYSLRALLIFSEITDEEAKDFLRNLVVVNNKWCFKSLESAKSFAEMFAKLNTEYYSGVESAVMFRAVGDCLKYSLENKYITYADLYTTDQEVIDKIKPCADNDAKFKALWDRMNGKIRANNNPDDYDALVYCKSRVIDPLYIDKEEVKRVSDVDGVWADFVKNETMAKEYYLKFK